MNRLGVKAISNKTQNEIVSKFSEIANNNGLKIDTCCEGADLSKYGIGHAACIDMKRLERIGNYRLKLSKDKNQQENVVVLKALILVHITHVEMVANTVMRILVLP